jgi:hypothetical protein
MEAKTMIMVAWLEMRVSSLTDLILQKTTSRLQIEDNKGKTCF